MRLLLLLFTFTSLFVYSQTYIIDKDVTIYGLGDGEFLTAKQINNKAHIKHYDITGNVIWHDSVSFSHSNVDNSKFEWISRFKNTDEVVFCMSGDLPPYWSFGNVEDTLLFNFTKLDLGSHQFIGVLEDTLVTNWNRSVVVNDTSIYVFFSDLSLGFSPRHYETYSLNSNMQFSLVAPPDSLPVENFGMSLFSFNDTIYKYQNYQDYHFIEKYNSQMSLIERYDNNFITGEEYDFSHYKTPLNKDSLFVFVEGFTYDMGGTRVKWRFDWRELNLSMISSTQFYSYTNDVSSPTTGIKTSFEKVKLDRVNRLVMILGEELIDTFVPPTLTTTNHQSIIIYDYNANFICDVPIWSGNNGSTNSNRLIELNGRVYLQSQEIDHQTLALVDCNTLGLKESNNQALNVSIYPNPVSEILNIQNPNSTELTICIQSLEGKEMEMISSNNSSLKIDLSEFDSGVFVLKIEGNGEFKTERIIKI